MKRKSWLTPILVFIICMAFLFSYQAKQGGSYLAHTIDSPIAPWNLEISGVSKIEFTETNKRITALIANNKWQLLEPLKTSADSAYIYNVLSGFTSPKFIAEVASDTLNLEEYGIDKFSKSIILYDSYRNKYELICGKEASSSTYYVYSPYTKTIYTMQKEYFDNVSSTLTKWRDKDYLHFEPKLTSKIKIYLNNTVHILEPNSIDDNISFTSSTLSPEKVDTIFNFLLTTRINTFIVDEASPTVVSNYGFDKPEITLSITDLENQTTTFSMNHFTDKSDQSYVMLKGTNSIYAVSSFQHIFFDSYSTH